ncbi:MAG: DUF721 domain-containing protein [Candidatus Rokubacteria bacterium]|nr:DUF721 domain-containing protein [Candidatus Rokubacteria bacterium]
MTDPVRVGEVLAALPGMAERLAEARLIAAWPEIAGPAATRSRAERVDGGVLHVAVESSGWLHRLTLDEASLLARCRAVAPTSDVRAIRFHLAPLGATEGEVPR